MRLTAFSDYTMRVLMFLATERGRLVTIPEIAAAYGISGNHLTKVVHQLVRAGVVESTRGKGGGIRLAREPGDIRLGAILRASEGGAPLVECLAGDANATAATTTADAAGTCCLAPVCRLSGVVEEAFSALYATFDRYTLADLVADPPRISAILVHRATPPSPTA